MVKVEFLGPIESDSLELDINSLKELSEYMLSNEKLKDWATNSAVAVNDKIVTDINTKLKDGDKVSILPPVCGG
jgi:molybdopterin synthase sulfur carrier subunit